MYEQYGRTSKLKIHPRDIPHIPLEVFREQRQIEKSEDHNIELSLIDSQKELLVDNHDELRSRAGNENLVEDLKKDQSTVEVCILEVHSERDTMQPSLMVPKGEVSKKNSGHSWYTWELHRNRHQRRLEESMPRNSDGSLERRKW